MEMIIVLSPKTGFLSVVNCCISAILSSRKNAKILPAENNESVTEADVSVGGPN